MLWRIVTDTQIDLDSLPGARVIAASRQRNTICLVEAAESQAAAIALDPRVTAIGPAGPDLYLDSATRTTWIVDDRGSARLLGYIPQ